MSVAETCQLSYRPQTSKDVVLHKCVVWISDTSRSIPTDPRESRTVCPDCAELRYTEPLGIRA